MNEPNDWTDKDVKAAFIRMLTTIAMWVTWFLFTIYWGIIRNMFFFDDPHIVWWQHALIFGWVAVSTPVLIWFTIFKIWKMKR